MVDVANSEFNYSNVSPVTTDFNVTPYYDDFNDNKNYYKLLFKPGYAVQARELTQIQSMLQDQIQKFGQHVFKEGSMVLGGKFDINTRANYVKVNDLDLLDNTVDISMFKDQIVTGQTTGIKAYVNLVLDGTEGTDTPKTLYITYLSANPDTDETVFTANEPLISNVGTLIVANTIPVGYGSVFTLNEGVRFAKEHFIYHNKQSVVIDRYDILPTCRVGFYLEESIVNASSDSSLLDPALESSNYSAPGADRFKITPILTRLEYDDVAGFPNFVSLFLIKNGVVTEISERPTYNIIRDEIAKRTFDESGDYYVKGFNVIVEEHLDTGDNGGYLALNRGGDSQLLSIQVEPGTAYVKGYEVNKLVTEYITTPKSTSFSNVADQIVTTKLGNYIVVNEAVGAWNLSKGSSIDLYDTAQKRLTNTVSSTAAQTGKKIGSAFVKSITFDNGTLGTPAGSLKVHLFNISMLGSNSFSSVKSVFYDNSSTSSANICGDIVLTSSNTAVISEAYSPLLYYVGTDYTKSIRSSDETIPTSYTFKSTSAVSIASGGTFSISSTTPNEIFPYGTSSLSSTDVRDIVLNIDQSFNIALPGTATGGASSTTLTGTSTYFSRLNVGDKIAFSGNNSVYRVVSIANNTSLTVNATLPATLSTNTINKVYKTGDVIDLTTLGVDSGLQRTVSATPTSLTFDLKETFGTTVSGTVSYSLSRTGAREITKILKPSRYVQIRVDTHPSGLTGPYDLGFSDVVGVLSVRKDTVPFTSTTQGVDVTSSYTLNRGQFDDYYGHGSIKPITSASAGDYLLVEVNYYQPDYTLGVGYFSIDSYPINDSSPTTTQITTTQIPFFTSPTTGKSFDLRNYLDFRPVLTNTASDSIVPAGSTTNPSSSTTFQNASIGLKIPAESEQLIYDYSYYLSRIDIVALNPSGQFTVINGVSSVRPITPACPDSLMSCARIYVPPYPSLSPSNARLIGRNDLACSVSRTSQVRFTMKDIGVLKQRVDNVENYVSLSLLEKSAADMKILDENGLDRFKNGIFVDSFTSFTLADIGNRDHHICYDPKEGSIRPIFETQALGYMYSSGTNVIKENNLIMLPYTEVVAAQQPYATTFRNVETTVYKWIGQLYLHPDSDYWVNTNRLASQTYKFGSTDSDITPYSVVYGSWQTTVTGVKVTDPVLISSTTSYSSSSTGGGSTTTLASGYGTFSSSGQAAAKQVYADLLATYGANYPITVSTEFTGEVTPGVTTLGNLLNVLGYWGIEGGDTFTVTPGGTITYTTTNSNTYQTSISTGTQQTRSYVETFQKLQTESQSIGDKVVAVAPIADIRPQTIAFEGRGIKSNTKYFVYFDGQLMTKYVTPCVLSSTPTNLGANTNIDLYTPIGTEGSDLYSDKDGFVYGLLRLPSDGSKTFRTGTKEVLLTDSPTNEPDAMSTSRAYFAAQGITQTVQETILSTSQVVTETKSGVEKTPIVYSNTTNTYTVTTTTSTAQTKPTILGFQDNSSCMGYSFKLNTPSGEEGTFLSSVDIFCAAKDPSVGLWFEIRAMDNAGTITRVTVPGSKVFLSSDRINVSDDGSVATNVKFSSPVFLKNNTEYAFIIHIAGFSPNYYMFVSVLGETDIITGQKVNARPLTGTLYTTNNNTDWDMVQRVDLKVTFNRAKFSTGAGEVILGNEQREYILIPDMTSTKSVSWFGERIVSADELNLSTPVGGTIQANNLLIGSSSGANSRVVSINGSRYKMSNTGYIVGETVTAANANGSLYAVTATVVSKNTAAGYIYNSFMKNDVNTFNGNNIVLVVKDSNGLFVSNDSLIGEFSGNTVGSSGLTKFIYSTIQFEPSYLNFAGTSCKFSMLTTSNTGTVGSYYNINESVPTDFDEEKAIFSRSTEVSQFNGDSSNRIKASLTTSSDYLSPVINLDRTYTVFVHNLINSNTTGELSNSGGGLKNKYISQIITLADGQDAEDLKIILSAYRPPSSNSIIKVYARISHAEDFESISSRNWFELTPFDSSSFSSLANRKDWREFSFNIPDSMKTSNNDQGVGIVQYTNSVGTVFTGFKQFQIKIGLQSDSSAIFPRVADLRAIALQL